MKKTVIISWITTVCVICFVGLVWWIDWITSRHRFWYLYGTIIGMTMMIIGFIISLVTSIVITIKYFINSKEE